MTVAFCTMTVMVAPEMASTATWPSRAAPIVTRSNTDLPRYWSVNACSRASEMPAARIGSSCCTIASPVMRPARSKPTSVLIGLPEYAGMRTTSPVRKT